MRIAVCDDEPIFVQQLVELIETQPQYDLMMQIDTYSSGETLLEAIQQGETYDLLFLDILLGGISGIDVIEALRQPKEKNCIIVLVSSSHQHVAKAFNLQVTQYLFKPIVPSEFTETFSRCLDLYKQQQQLLAVVIDRIEQQLPLKNILYFESQKRKIIAVSKWGDSVAFYGKLDNLEKQFEAWSLPNMVRVHQSYLVNLAYCTGLDKQGIYLKGEETAAKIVPISMRREAEVKRKVHLYMIMYM